MGLKNNCGNNINEIDLFFSFSSTARFIKFRTLTVNKQINSDVCNNSYYASKTLCPKLKLNQMLLHSAKQLGFVLSVDRHISMNADALV